LIDMFLTGLYAELIGILLLSQQPNRELPPMTQMRNAVLSDADKPVGRIFWPVQHILLQEIDALNVDARLSVANREMATLY